jgi:hypothetical protein
MSSLYEQLAAAPGARSGAERRTDSPAGIAPVDTDLDGNLYQQLGQPVLDASADLGETEITRDDKETVDKDRVDIGLLSALVSGPTSLYSTLADAPVVADATAETALTAASETIDWDRPPQVVGLY